MSEFWELCLGGLGAVFVIIVTQCLSYAFWVCWVGIPNTETAASLIVLTGFVLLCLICIGIAKAEDN